MSRVVVFDANVFVQAALSGTGPAFRCLAHVKSGECELLVSEAVLDEVREVLDRLSQVAKYSAILRPDAIDAYMDLFRIYARVVPEPPSLVSIPRDPDDEAYLNLAIAFEADYLVTRDKDLLEFELNDPAVKLPKILSPWEFLQQLM